MEIESESLEDIELGIHFANDTLEKIEKLTFLRSEPFRPEWLQSSTGYERKNGQK